jgi:hypothetical protein
MRAEIIDIVQSVAALPIGGDLAPARERIEAMIAAEREACAKLADRHAEDAEHLTQAENTAILIAADIRARR